MDAPLVVRARGIGRSFGRVVALEDVDLDLVAGQIHGVLGPNGAGKTTLLGMLLQLTVPDSGSLEILGVRMGRGETLPDGVAGFVDGPGMYPSLTARQNLAAVAALGGDDRAGIDAELAQVGLIEVADERVRGFSLGMRQRLGLAAALLARPQLLVLDEPANGLDPAGTRQVHQVLTRLAAGGTSIILSSHRMDDLAALCSEVTILVTGRVVFSGPVRKLTDEVGELDYRLRTSDPDEARRVSASTQGVRLLPEDELLQRQDAQALLIRATASSLDELVPRLVTAGVGVRELAPVVPPLEAAFLALTGRTPQTRDGRTRDDRRPAGPPVTAVPLPAPAPRRAPLGSTYRFELVKLLSQWRVRLMFIACLLVPAGFVAVIGQQNSLPADTVFGRWMSQTGWAGPLVLLAFCSSWVLPLLTSLVAGDVFATEDRLGTWRHLLVAVRSRQRVFAAKAAASLTVILGLMAGLAGSGITGGLLAVGNHDLAGLDGHLLGPGAAARMVLLAWACALAPTLAFAAVGLLGSVLFGRSPMGLITPALLALLLGIGQLLPLPIVIRAALPSYAFLAWRGLFTDPVQLMPVAVGVLVSLVWAVAATGLAYWRFLHRDLTDAGYDGAGRRVLVAAALPLVAVFAATTAALALAQPGAGSGIDRPKVDASLGTAYAHLYRLQARELGRPDVTEAQLRAVATCDKGGALVDDTGPGNDWRCVVTWHLPGTTATGQAVYQLDLHPDGRYVADGDGPQSVNGFFPVPTAAGAAPNPLWQFDGLVDLLRPSTKG